MKQTEQQESKIEGQLEIRVQTSIKHDTKTESELLEPNKPWVHSGTLDE